MDQETRAFLASELPGHLPDKHMADTALAVLETTLEREVAMQREGDKGQASLEAESWLQWAAEEKYVKLSPYIIPDGILPAGYRGELVDAKVFPARKGPMSSDDAVYEKNAEIRARVARGNCFLRLTHGDTTGVRCAVYAMKKFTGGMGDDDDNEDADEMAWRAFFSRPPEDAALVVSTEKANGEAAHFSACMVGDSLYYLAGSKNNHIIFQNEEHIKAFADSRYQLATVVARTVLKQINSFDEKQRQRLINFVLATRFTLTFEMLQPTNQHVELLHGDEPSLVFIAFTSTLLTPLPGCALCSLNPVVAILLARTLGLNTVNFVAVPPTQVDQRVAEVRKAYGREGDVLYFVDNDGGVIGLLKKKSVWYIIARAVREKTRNTTARVLKVLDGDGGEKAMEIEKLRSQLMNKLAIRMEQIHKWLTFLPPETMQAWTALSLAFAEWVFARVLARDVTAKQTAELFPLVWQRFLSETGATDRIE